MKQYELTEVLDGNYSNWSLCFEMWPCIQALNIKPYKDGNQWCFLYGKNIQDGICGFGKTIRDAALDFYCNICNEEIVANKLKSLRLQPKQEWSEEDEERLKAICTYLQDYPRLAKINDVKRFNEYCDWLKSLPLNLKKKNEDVAKLCSNEWSKEDEANRTFILESLEDQIRFCKKDAKGAYYTKQIRTAQNWLKSLSLNLKKKNEDVAKLCSNE